MVLSGVGRLMKERKSFDRYAPKYLLTNLFEDGGVIVGGSTFLEIMPI